MATQMRRLFSVKTKEGKYSLTLPGPLNSELEEYMAAYKESYPDEPITPETVITAMVHHFLEADVAFRAWKKDHDTNRVTKPRKAGATTGTTAAGSTS